MYLINTFNKECPFHLEFVRWVEAPLAVLKINLKESVCGPDMIDNGEFVVEESGTENLIDINGPWDSYFYPGQKVTISMVFQSSRSFGSSCPRCHRSHEESTGKKITWCVDSSTSYILNLTSFARAVAQSFGV